MCWAHSVQLWAVANRKRTKAGAHILPCGTPHGGTWHEQACLTWPIVFSDRLPILACNAKKAAWGVSACHWVPLSLFHQSFSTVFFLSPFPITDCHLPSDPISCCIIFVSNYLHLNLSLWTPCLSSFLSASATMKAKDEKEGDGRILEVHQF